MKILLTLISFSALNLTYGQLTTKISGTIVDEAGKPVANAAIHYGDRMDDTAYTSQQGWFKVAYPNAPKSRYYFYIERDGFLPKSIFVDLASKDTILNKPIALRSRKGFWYDAKTIDSTHLGISVKEAIAKYKLDIDECSLWDEPPGSYHNFTAELGDSSYITVIFKGIFSKEKRLKMTDVLDRVITGIGIGFTNGTELEFGNGFVRENPYFVERQMKIGTQ